jgi:hypothetical protein
MLQAVANTAGQHYPLSVGICPTKGDLVAKRQKKTSDLRRYAVVGAEQRLLELAEEAAAIFAIFPELRAQGRGFMARAGGRGASAAGDAVAAPTKRRRRRKMSAEARKRISDAQKARWARQKAAGGGKKK